MSNLDSTKDTVHGHEIYESQFFSLFGIPLGPGYGVCLILILMNIREDIQVQKFMTSVKTPVIKI